MSRFFLEPAANQTLDDIYQYTKERWDQAQADRYLTGLFETFEGISNDTVVSRDAYRIFGIKAQFCRYQSHYVYWKRLADGRIGIMAIIHQSRHQLGRFAEAEAEAENETE